MDTHVVLYVATQNLCLIIQHMILIVNIYFPNVKNSFHLGFI